MWIFSVAALQKEAAEAAIYPGFWVQLKKTLDPTTPIMQPNSPPVLHPLPGKPQHLEFLTQASCQKTISPW